MVEYVYRIQWGMLVCIQGTVGDAGVYTRYSEGMVVCIQGTVWGHRGGVCMVQWGHGGGVYRIQWEMVVSGG